MAGYIGDLSQVVPGPGPVLPVGPGGFKIKCKAWLVSGSIVTPIKVNWWMSPFPSVLGKSMGVGSELTVVTSGGPYYISATLSGFHTQTQKVGFPGGILSFYMVPIARETV